MPGFATGVAATGTPQEVCRVGQEGPVNFLVHNQGDYPAVMAFLRSGGGAASPIMTSMEEQYTQLVSDGEALENVPVVPRSVRLVATGKPTLYDRDGDGVLRIFRTAGVLLAGGGSYLGVGVGGTTSAAATKTLTVAGETFTTKGVRVGDKLVITDGLDKGVYTVTVRNSATVLTVDRAWPVGGQTNVGYAIYSGDLDCGRVDYLTGLLKLSYPSGDSPAGKGRTKGTCTFPLSIDPGMTLVIGTDHAGGGTVTWDAAAAVASGTLASFATLAAETFKASINGGPLQTITMGTEVNPADAVTKINAQLIGATAARDLVNSTHAAKTTTSDFPLALSAGDTLKMKVDGGAEKTATWDAAAAVAVGAGGAFAQLAGETFDVRFTTGGTWTQVTMGTELTIDLALATIIAQLVGTGGTAVKKDANNINLVSDIEGTGGVVQTQNVAAGITTKLGIQNNASEVGTGDVVNIAQVSQAEFKTVVEADVKTAAPGDLVLVSNVSTKCKLTETTATVGWYSYLEITGGTGAAALGLALAVTRGQDMYTITTDKKGTGATVALSSVAAGITTKLGLSSSTTATGTGDVADIDAVTYAEFASRVTADTTSSVLPDLEDGNPVLISNTAYTGASSTIQVSGGTAQGLFGFDGASHAGNDSGAEQSIQATYLQSYTLAAGKKAGFRVMNLPEHEVIVTAAGLGGSSPLHVSYDGDPRT